MMKNRYSLLVGLFFFLGYSVFSQEKSVEAYFVDALSKDAAIQSLSYEMQAAEKRVDYVGKLPDPTLMTSAFLQPVETRMGPQRASFALSQSIPWFGKLESKRSVADQMISIKSEQIASRENQLRKEVYFNYLEMYFLDFKIILLNENLEWYNQLKNLIAIKIQSGRGSSLDLLQVEIQILKLQKDIDDLKDDKSILLEKWKRILNDQNAVYPEEFYFPTNELSESYDDLLLMALDSNNDMRVSKEMIKQKELQTELAGFEGKPDFTLGATYINIGKRTDMVVTGSGSDAWLFPQVGLRIPINQKKYRSQVSEQQFLTEAERFKQVSIKNDISANFGEQIYNYSKYERSLDIDMKLIQLNEQALEIMLSEYTSGLRKFEDLLLLESQLLSFKISAENARVNKQKAITMIQFLSGVY